MNLRTVRDAGGTSCDRNGRGRNYTLSIEKGVRPCTPGEKTSIGNGGHKPCY